MKINQYITTLILRNIYYNTDPLEIFVLF